MSRFYVTNRQLLTVLNSIKEELQTMSANTDPALLAIQQALADTQAALVQLQTQATNIENGLAGVLAQLNSGDDNAVSAAAATLETVATQIGGIATALGTAAAAIPTPPAAAAPTS